LIREAEIMNALSRAIPNVTGVHVPLSGTSSFTAYVSIRQGRPGEAKHVIPIVLGVDHYLKLVIVVDDDIDVFDESDVLWAVATRMQSDRDLVVISGSLGAMLDPSADERGVTAKLGIDATRPFGEPFGEKLVLPALLGARLLFVASNWGLYRGEPARIWRRADSGAALYGGLIVSFLLSLPLLRALGISVGEFWDATIVTMLIGMAFTKIGCL